MTRASAAHAESCLPDEAWPAGADVAVPPAAARRTAGRRPRTPSTTSLVIAAALMVAMLITFQHLRDERETALRAAAHEAGMRASIVAAQ